MANGYIPEYRLNYGGQQDPMALASMYQPQQPNAAQQIGQVAQMAGMMPSPAAPILQGAGLLANLYGTFQAGNQAQKNYQLQKEQFEAQLAERERDRKKLEDAQRLSNIYSAANYTTEAGQQDQDAWRQYLRQVRA